MARQPPARIYDRSAAINRGLAAWWPLSDGAIGRADELVRGIPGVGTSVGAGVLRYGYQMAEAWRSRWYFGPCGWVLADVRTLATPPM
jgi:hypothetical protein